MIFRLSRKIAKKIKAGTLAALPLEANPYDDWSCHLFTANRTQYLILCNTKSLYSCVMYGKGIANGDVFVERASSAIRKFLKDDGEEFAYASFIASTAGTIRFAKSLNRLVICSMNELVLAAEYALVSHEHSAHDAGFYLNDWLLSAIATEPDRGYGSPKDAFRLLADAGKRAT